MRCDRVQRHLSALRDGELRADLARAVEQHCAKCDACRGERDLLRRADRLARQVCPAEEPLSPVFIGDLERRIAREGSRPLPEPAGGNARALIPMAAAVLLGATLTFVGMRTLGPGRSAAPAGPLGASEYSAFEASRDRFAAASDVVLTGLDDLSLADPGTELRLVRREVQAADVPAAIAAVRSHIPDAADRDPRLASRLAEAVEGMQVVLTSLDQPGAADEVLLGARREMMRRRLVQSVRGLAPEGLPRPARLSAPLHLAVRAERGGSEAGVEVFLDGVRAYAGGAITEARQAFETAARQTPHRDQRARAAYWASRCYTLQNRPEQATRLLNEVADWSPEAATGLFRFILRSPGGEVVVFQSGPNGNVARVEQQGRRNRVVITQGGSPLDGSGADPLGGLRVLIERFEHDGPLRRELRQAMREVSRFEAVLGPALSDLVDVESLRADGAPISAVNLPALKKVLPVMLARFSGFARLQVRPAAGGERATLVLSTRNCRFGSWEARSFVQAIGGSTATALQGAETGDPESACRSTLQTLEIDVRLPESLRRAGVAWFALGEVPEAGHGAAAAPPGGRK